jgi:asparagine synthase (glutamine-hydrolysing)
MGMRPFEIKQLTDKPFLRADALLPDADIHTRNTPESLYYYDLAYYIGAHHVYRDDMSAMRYSLEVRYPYLDHELIEWVANLPMHMRFDGVTTKPLLRKVAERYITKENMNMPKKGFNLPLHEWMQHADVIQQYARMQLDRLKQRGIFDNATIEKWWQRRNEGVYFSKLWQLVTTEVWLNEYVSA